MGGGHNSNHGQDSHDSHSKDHGKKDYDNKGEKKEKKEQKEHKEQHSSFTRNAILNSVQQGLERLTAPAAYYLANSPWIRPLINKIRAEKPKDSAALKHLITDFAAGFGGTGAKEFILFFFRKFPFISRILDADEVAEIGEEVLSDFIQNLQAAIEASEKYGDGSIRKSEIHNAAVNAVAPLAQVVCFQEQGPARRLHDIECVVAMQNIKNMQPISRTAYTRLKGQKVSFDPNCCGDLAEANLKEVKFDAPAHKAEEELTSVVETMSYLIENKKHGVNDTHRDLFLFWIATLSEDDTKLLNKVADRKREVAELLIAKDDDQRNALLKGMKSRDFATKVEDAADKFTKDNTKIAADLRAKAVALRAKNRGEDPAPKPTAQKTPEELAPELTATAEDGKVTLSWTPAVSKSGKVTHYMVKTYQYDAVTNVSTTPDIEDADNATSFEKTGLTNGQRYLFRIDAKAGSTLLASSNEASAMPKAAPAVPAAGPTPTPAPKEGGFTKVAKGFIKFLTGDY